MPIAYIYRGLPGSGKTTAANKLGCLVISPMDMRVTHNGKYNPLPNETEWKVQAMAFAQDTIRVAVSYRIDFCIAEVLPSRADVDYWVNYIHRLSSNYQIRIVHFAISPADSLVRNTHNVPWRTILAMANSFENYPGEAQGPISEEGCSPIPPLPSAKNERGFDPVNRPEHYNVHPSGLECIQVTQHMNFCLGNAMKYLWRAGLKGGEDKKLEDLKKAGWYINQELERLEGMGTKNEMI